MFYSFKILKKVSSQNSVDFAIESVLMKVSVTSDFTELPPFLNVIFQARAYNKMGAPKDPRRKQHNPKSEPKIEPHVTDSSDNQAAMSNKMEAEAPKMESNQNYVSNGSEVWFILKCGRLFSFKKNLFINL